MNKAFLIYPHQIFEYHLTHSSAYLFYILEEPLYFDQYRFHKQKLILHRASMKYYEESLQSLGHKVFYWEAHQLVSYHKLLQHLKEHDIAEVHYWDVTDDWLEQKIVKELGKGWPLTKHETPMFLSDSSFLKEQFDGKKHFSMASFYTAQRKRMNLLVDKNKPVGGRWSFDEDNRKKLPKTLVPPPKWVPENSAYVDEAIAYVEKNYSSNPGDALPFTYAVTHPDARQCLLDFLQNRFVWFGPYEDAISGIHTHVYHSVLSAYLNNGLLTPAEVVAETMNYAEKHHVPLNSLEGFLRQIIGWREFMLGIYLYKGRRERTVNFWDHTRKLPYSFWEGNTGIDPVDMVIKRVLRHAYSHHIERLMVMGNFMLLCEINPDDIYRWFMEMYIDAYDWVMVPNVYSMSQYAGGGTATTKPYLSGSNYILKMSNFREASWCEVWNALYWRFIDKYRSFFSENPRISALTIHLQKMDTKILLQYHKRAETFLNSLDNK